MSLTTQMKTKHTIKNDITLLEKQIHALNMTSHINKQRSKLYPS